MPVHPEERDEIVSRIERKYEGDIRRGDETPEYAGISTGSLELDAAMGGKGVPQGQWTRFYGGYSSTKTLTAYNVIAEAQKLGLLCAYYNVEKQYHKEFVELRGVDTKELTIVEGTSVEGIGEKMEALLGVAHLHVIDSCSIAVSEDELNADIRDWRPGITARAWGKVFRRLNERFDHRENTVILIDQVRVNFRTGSEDPAGGKVFDHQSSMSVLFKKGGWLYRNEHDYIDDKAKQQKGISGQTEPAGIEIKARVEKSRVCRPFRTATMRFDLDKLDFDRDFEYVKAAKFFEIVDSKGGGNYYMNDKRIAKGDAELREFIRGDLTLQEQIKESVMKAAER